MEIKASKNGVEYTYHIEGVFEKGYFKCTYGTVTSIYEHPLVEIDGILCSGTGSIDNKHFMFTSPEKVGAWEIIEVQ